MGSIILPFSNAFVIYKAGECFPLLGPKGCLEQDCPVKLAIVELLDPQYLQTY